MQTLIAICAVLAALFSLLAFGVAVVIAKQIKDAVDGSWEDSVVLDNIGKNILDLAAFIKHRYDQASAANGMFREKAATAETKLSEHLAQCHADDPKPEDTPAFTELINEEATHKLAEFFEAAGIKPDEASKSIELIEGEVTQLLDAEGNSLPLRDIEDIELPFEPEEEVGCPRDEHRYNKVGICTECGADGVQEGDIDPDMLDEEPEAAEVRP